jgi:hypothetical protein
LEANFSLACLGFNDSQLFSSSKIKNVSEEKNNDALLSVSQFILQSSELEESNFKEQFFVTRSSFQVNNQKYNENFL